MRMKTQVKSVSTGLARKMNDQDGFVPIVFDESTQVRQIAHLKKWVTRVSEVRSDDYSKLLCRGLTKFIELDLFRHGRKPGSFSGDRGFGVIRQSSAAQSFLESEIMPTNLDVAALLTLVADGRVMADTGYGEGEPALIFFLG